MKINKKWWKISKKDKNHENWVGLIVIAFLYPLLFICLLKIYLLFNNFINQNLSVIFFVFLLPLFVYLVALSILISFKNKFVLIGGIISSIIGILFGFSFISKFAFDNIKSPLIPLAQMISYLMKLIMGESELFWNIFIFPQMFIFLFALIGAIIGYIISKQKKNVK